jgi:hypothetical protein
VRGLNKLTYMRAHPTLNATNSINEENSFNNNDINNISLSVQCDIFPYRYMDIAGTRP